MEEAPVETGTLELSHRAGVAVRKNGLRPIVGVGNLPEPPRDYGHGIVPRDSLEAALAFCAGALHRIFQPVGMIDAIEIARYLLAQKAAREGMIPVAAQVDRLAVLHLHDHAARVGAVMRADGAYGPGWAGNHGNSGHHRPTAS